MEKPITDLFSGFSLSNDRLRKVYAAVTNDDITKQEFWADFKQSAKRRGDCAHNGERGTKADAWDAYRVCTAFVKHVKTVCLFH